MNSRIRQLRHLAVAIAAVLTFTQTPAAEAQPPGLPGTTITVNSLADGNVIVWPPGSPLPCMLRDAIRAANTNLPVGGCPAGQSSHYVSGNPVIIDFIDRIVFNVGTGTPKIQLRNALPSITEEVTIDGATGGATRIEIAGNQIISLFGPVHGITVTSPFATLKSLVVNGFSGHGILLSHLEGGGGGGNTVLNCLIGTNAAGNGAVPNGTNMTGAAGIAILTPGNLIGGTAATDRNVISGNRGYGVLIDDVNNSVIGSYIGTGLSTNVSIPNQLDGIYVAGGQFSNAGGEIRSNVIANNGGDGVDGGYTILSILSNRIHSNGALGIDRAAAGVTPNV